MTPAVRRLLREHGLEASQVPGTGGGGRITREDVIAVVEAQRTGTAVAGPAASAPSATRPPGRPPRPSAATNAGITFPAGADEVLVPMTQMRKGIAAQMTRALAVPHAYVQMEIDVTRLVAPAREAPSASTRRRKACRSATSRSSCKASAEALKRNPDVQRPLDRRRACWPSAGSTSAWRWRSTTA